MNGIETLLLNVLLLTLIFLFIPLLVERNPILISYQKKKWLHIILAALAIIISMLFPINFGDSIIFDLRMVALIVGGLYGGISGSLFLLAITIISRFVIGVNTGAFSNIITSTIVVLFLVIVTNYFNQVPMKKKLIIGSIFSFFTGVWVIIVHSAFLHLLFPNGFLSLYLLLLIGTSTVIIYVTEIIREMSFLHKRVVKAEKMEVVSHLASSISHEVRNPLAVVRGFLQMMGQNELPEEKRKEFISICIGEIDRANDIIRNYLTFAKPTPDRIEILDIKQELKKAIGIITPLANMNSIIIETDIENSYFIKGDQQLIQQCLLNITKNCIEAMPESGKLFIKTIVESDQLIIEIKDTGVGMTEEQLSRIGEPYFTTKGREGTGLGMLSVMKIIEMFNGQLNVSSKINEGTTFRIVFPLFNHTVSY